MPELQSDTQTTTHDVAVALLAVYEMEWSREVAETLFSPTRMGSGLSLDEASGLFGPYLPDGLLPLAFVDEDSIAVVAMEPLFPGHSAGYVYRYHLRDIASEHQLALLDVDPLFYISSVNEELLARSEGLRRVLDVIGPAYKQSHVDSQKRPRDYVVRPIRLACQNVIVGLAAIAQDASFDGLSVVAWQTCEVPHLATHEGNRTLAALTLCDTFQNGGTMEVRFDRSARVNANGRQVFLDGHPEGSVPASLKRFGRARGIPLGEEEDAAITPSEARELFMEVTPMPSGLRARADDAISTRGITPERICFTLLSQVWREIELDFILATSSRASSILDGGADWQHRGARQAEAEVCRAAAMIGMLYRRLNSLDHAGGNGTSEIRVVEDRTRGASWEISGEDPCVTFTGLDAGEPIPWTGGLASADLRVVACSAVTEGVRRAATAAGATTTAVLVPRDVHPEGLPPEVPILRCPDRRADLDKAVEAKLLKSRISRG